MSSDESSQGDVEGITAFRAALPPLTERIDPADGRELPKLFLQLLRVHAGARPIVPLLAADQSLGGALAPDGVPGLEGGIVFYFPPLGSEDAWDLDTSGAGRIAHRVVVTASPEQRGRWPSFAPPSGARHHHWGQAEVETLLRRCPALLARYYPQEARAYLPGYDGTDFDTLAARYREKVAFLHNRLKTFGIPPEVRPRESRLELPLADLFIPLRLVPSEDYGEPVDLSDVLGDTISAVVLADPGMGKSTLLAYLALIFAGGAVLPGFACPLRRVPLHISLRDFVRRQKQRPGLTFLEYLEIEARELHSLDGMHRAFFEAALRMGEAVVLFDGLDEVGNETARHNVAASIRAFQADYPGCRFWVTSRVYGYTDNVRLPRSFAHYRIGHLDDAQIDGFVTRWYQHQITANPKEAAEQAASLQAAVQRTPSVRRLASNPLLLTLMAFIHHAQRRLPRDRGELYEKCIEMLLKTWREAKRGEGDHQGITLSVPTQKDYLAHLAFFIQQKNQGGTDEEARGLVSRREAIEALAVRHLARAQRERPALTDLEARHEMAGFLDYVCDETGLVLDRGNDQLSFIHLSFQEYLTAWVFVCDDEMPHGPDFFQDHLGDPTWEEVLLLRLYIILREGGGVRRFDDNVSALLRALERTSGPAGWLTMIRAVRDDLEFTDRDRKDILARALRYWLEAPAFEGTWFTALEEVKLFAERARGILREVIASARALARKPADAIALLHLETRLFGFPAEAADVLRGRADLGELLADLVPFVDEPAIRALLAEKCGHMDWSRALRELEGPETYPMTVRWMAQPPAPAAAEAATAFLWEKILADLRSRTAFAAPRRAHADAVLFDQPGALTWKTPVSSATLPYCCLRVLPASLPAAVPTPTVSLLCAALARVQQNEAAIADARSELVAWTTSLIISQLGAFSAAEPLSQEAVVALAALFVRSFVRSFGRTFIHSFSSAYIRSHSRAFVHDFGRDFGRSVTRHIARGLVRDNSHHFDRSYGRDFCREFVHDFGRELAHDFGQSFVRDFGQSFVRDLGRNFGVDPNEARWETAWNRAMEDKNNQIRLFDSEVFWIRMLTSLGDNDIDPKKKITTLNPGLKNPLALPLLLADIWSAAGAHILFTSTRRTATAHLREEDISPNALETWSLTNPVEIYATAFAWQEHCKPISKIEGPSGALFLAHAAYATLMTGLECQLPVTPDLTDPRVRFSYVLYELCNFRDAEANARQLHEMVASPTPELRPLLEAAGLLSAGAHTPAPPQQPARIEPVAEPMPAPDPVLFSWLHLSDIHFGHRDIGHRWDQKLVLDTLYRDIIEQTKVHPAPSALFVTGDVAFSGAEQQYAEARTYLDKLASTLKISADRIFIVPGNHDVDRANDKKNRNLSRMLRNLREGDDSLDEVLEDTDDRALLTSRLAAYLSFASAYPSLQRPDPLYWSHAFTTALGLPVRIIGLNTALLAADDVDREKLRLGNAQRTVTLTDADRSRELVLVLSHHPLHGWLADQRDADRWIQSRAHVHLFGHVHEANSEDARSGSGAGLIRVTAGAAHGDMLPPDVPASHGYSTGAVVAAPDGSLRLRLWPRMWSDKSKSFRVDVNNVPDGRPYAEHLLPALRINTEGVR